MGYIIKINISGENIPNNLKVKAINEVTGEEIELENKGKSFEKSVVLGKYKIIVELDEKYKIDKNNFEVELTKDKKAEDTVVISKIQNDDSQTPITFHYGDNQTVKLGEKISDIKISEDISKFVRLLIDGNEVNKDYYSLVQGSTIVKFKEAFTDTLAIGTHTLVFEFTTGKIETTLTIANRDSSDNNNSNNNSNNSNNSSNSNNSNNNSSSNNSNSSSNNSNNSDNNNANTTTKTRNNKLVKTGISNNYNILLLAITAIILSSLFIRKRVNK